MATTSRLMTAAELARLPDDDQRYELIAGELQVRSPGKPRHGRVTARITAPLGEHVSAHDLGEVFGVETGFLIANDPDTVRAPDAAFVRKERIKAVGDTDDWWPGAPDLVVEVVSPDDSYWSVSRESQGVGARHAVPWSWMVGRPRARRAVPLHRPTMQSTADRPLHQGA